MPRLADNLDLCLAYNMEEGTMESIQIKYLNLLNLLYAFKIVRNMVLQVGKTSHMLSRCK